MSKRHGATSVIDYQKMGYLPEAMRNYLLRLGWSHGDAEIISDEEAIKWFGLEKVGKSPSRFDFAKLNHLNKHYIKAKSDEELLTFCSEFFGKELTEDEKVRIWAAMKFLKERAETLLELANIASIYLDEAKPNFDEAALSALKEKQNLIDDLQQVFTKLNQWDHDGIKGALNEFAQEKNLKIKDFGPLIRLILTYSSSSAGGIFDVIEILGKSEVLNRFKSLFSQIIS